MTTQISLTVTTINYFEPIEKETGTLKVNRKVTVKESKELIPTDTIYINKEVSTEEFEVNTEELIAIKL